MSKRKKGKSHSVVKGVSVVGIGILIGTLLALVIGQKELSANDIYEHTKKSVVKVEREKGGSGTGFYMRGNKGGLLLITNAHVCGDVKNTLKITPTGTDQIYYIKPAYLDHVRDICLAYPHESEEKVPLKLGKKLISGAKVYASGHPEGKILSVRSGMYFGTTLVEVGGRLESPEKCLSQGGKVVNNFFYMLCVQEHIAQMTTVKVIGGNSGGPLLDKYGEVVGITFAADENTGLALPFETVRDVVATF